MSQRLCNRPVRSDPEVDRLVASLSGHLGVVVREQRLARGWTIKKLAAAAGLAPSFVHWVESGRPARAESYVRIARALRLRFDADLIDPRRGRTHRDEDPVHSAMGEVLAARIARSGYGVSLDEPYQHYQFAGRGDVVAWSTSPLALLHVENRTQLPNFQDAAGAYNAKRRWLPASHAERLGVRGFESVTHAFVCLWSAEMLHAARLRTASLRAICPDGIEPFVRWLAGEPPETGVTSSFVVFDPIRRGRADRRELIDLDTAVRASTRPRYRGYMDAVEQLRSAGLA